MASTETRSTRDSHGDGNGNAALPKDEALDGHKSIRKSSWQTTIESFTPVWFTLAMNTGIIGLLMWELPYQFQGLRIIATIFYVLDIIIFGVAMVLTILRWTLYPQAAKRKVLSSMDELCMHGAMPIAFLTIVALTALIPSNAYWGHHAFTLVAYVLWWIATAFMFTTGMVVSITIFKTKMASEMPISTALFLPAVGLSTNAVVGGVLCNYSYNISARLAIPVLIVSYLLDGLAIWFSVTVYVLYFHQLMSTGFPEAARTPALWLLVGPFGQTAAALLLAGSAAESMMQFAEYGRGTFLTASGAMSASGAGVLIALIIFGFELFWITVCTWAVLEAAFKKRLSYSLLWWSTIFPMATVATTCISLSIAMDSPAFRVLSTAILIYLVANYLTNLAFTCYYSITGSLLIKPPEFADTGDRKDD